MTPIQLQIEPGKARQIYKTAPPELRTILEESCGREFFSGKVTDRIKSYKDACTELGIEPMDEAEMLRQGFRQDEIDRRKLETITFALNGGEHLDWTNSDQIKWLPYFTFKAPSGFAFRDTSGWYSLATAGDASRLCFKSDELARYAGQTFTDLYRSIIDNKPSK